MAVTNTQKRNVGVQDPFQIDNKHMSPTERLTNLEKRYKYIQNEVSDVEIEIARRREHLNKNRTRKSAFVKQGVSSKHLGLVLALKQIRHHTRMIESLKHALKLLEETRRDTQNDLLRLKEEVEQEEEEEIDSDSDDEAIEVYESVEMMDEDEY